MIIIIKAFNQFITLGILRVTGSSYYQVSDSFSLRLVEVREQPLNGRPFDSFKVLHLGPSEAYLGYQAASLGYQGVLLNFQLECQVTLGVMSDRG